MQNRKDSHDDEHQHSPKKKQLYVPKGGKNHDETHTHKPVSLNNVFVVGIDGSEGSHNALELVAKNFHRRGKDQTLIVHITDTANEHHKGIDSHAKTIYNRNKKFLEDLNFAEDEYKIIFEERKENENVFEQINEIAEEHNGTLMVLGSHSGNGKKAIGELSENVKYLVHKPNIPCLVVKDKTLREYKIGTGFKWLLCIEGADDKYFRALHDIIKFVDVKNDIIHGFNVDKTGDDKVENEVKKHFEALIARYGVKHSQFDIVVNTDKKVHPKTTLIQWVSEHLQEETHFIDFIVLGYDASKYALNKDAPSVTVDVLKSIDCNCYFEH